MCKRHEFVSVELLRRIDFLAPVAGDTTTEAATAAVSGTGLVEPAIIHVADAFDAMTSTRSYRRALTQETAFDELRKGSGTQFNEGCVDALIAAIERRGERLRRRSRGRRARVGGRAARGRHRLGRARATSPEEQVGAGREAVRAASPSCSAGARSSRWAPSSRTRARKWAALALIGGAIAAGELIELRPPLRAPLPISFAFMVVLAERASVEDAALVLLVALLASFLVRPEPTSVEGRLALFVERLAEGLGAVVVYHGVVAELGTPPSRGERAARARGRVRHADRRSPRSHGWCASVTSAISMHGRSADLALITSAMLMAVSDRGHRRSRRDGSLGPRDLHDPAARGVVLVRAAQRDPRARTTRRSARSVRHPSSAASCARGTPSASRRSRSRRRASSASRVTSSSSSRPPRCCTISARCVSTSPSDGRAPDPAAVAQAGADDPAQHAAARARGRHHRGRADAVPRRRSAHNRRLMAGQVLKVTSAFDELSLGRPDSRVRRARSALLGAGLRLRRAGARRARGRARSRRPAHRGHAVAGESASGR